MANPFSLEVGVDSEEKLYQRIGGKASIYDLVYDMIIYKPDLATNIVIELVDARNVAQTIDFRSGLWIFRCFGE